MNNPFAGINNTKSIFDTNNNSLFGNTPIGGLFGPQPSQSLFGETPNGPANSLFQNKMGGGGNSNFDGGLFGSNSLFNNQQNNQSKEHNSSLGNSSNPFLNPSNALFGNNNNNTDNNKKGENSGKNPLFGNFGNNTTSSGLFGFNSGQNLFGDSNNENNEDNENKSQEEKENGEEEDNKNSNPFMFSGNNNEKDKINSSSSGLFLNNNINNENNIFINNKEETIEEEPKPNNTGFFSKNNPNDINPFSDNAFKFKFNSNLNNNDNENKENEKEKKETNKLPSLFSNPDNKEQTKNDEQNNEITNKEQENNNYNPFSSNIQNETNTNSNNNPGLFFKPEDNKEVTKNKKEEKKSIFEGSKKGIFSFENKNKEKENESEEENDNNIINTENQNSLFPDDNNNDLLNNLSKKHEKKNDIDENKNEMDVDEEAIKEETSSTKSDIINNIWISDNEEIIDDDTDVNKKIDYKKIEEKSKCDKNNLNPINSFIIPDISEHYFNLMKSTDNNLENNSTINKSIALSNKIIETLKRQIKIINYDERQKSELINIMTIFSYFDAFILHINDIIYLMKLRDELVYKYFTSDQIPMNMDPGNGNRSNIESIKYILENIYKYLSLLEISKAKQKMLELNRVNKEIIRKKELGNNTMLFNDLFLNMEKIIKIYNDIYSLKENFNSKQIKSAFNMNPIFQDVRETIFNLKKEINEEKGLENDLFKECEKICGLLCGDINFIINNYNQNSIHYVIMSNIFYRFYCNDFIKKLQECLNHLRNNFDIEKNLVNKYIITIINNCAGNQMEIVQTLKGSYPFLLRYHMIEILSQNNFLYQVENLEKYLKREAFDFYKMLKESKIPFKYFLNYFLFYPYYEIFTLEAEGQIGNLPDDPDDNMREVGYRKALDYALIYINYRFDNYEDIDELINEIDDIKREIREKIKNNYSNDIIYKINKLCLNKFIHKNLFKYSIIYYIDNYQLENEDFQKSQIYEIRKQLCAENEINYEYEKQFDKVIINFYLKTNHIFNINTFKETYNNNDNEKKIKEEYKEYQELLKLIYNQKNISKIDNNVLFLISYIEYLLDVIKHNFYKIEKSKGNNINNVNIVESTKKFLGRCFPLPKCPSFIWYHIVMLIKTVIDDNIYLFDSFTFSDMENNSSCEQLFIWDKKLIYDLIKIEKMKNNPINFTEAQKMYENAVTFLNDVFQGVYFNQNIFSNPENIYDYN